MGAEIERVNVRLVLPDGLELEENEVLVTSDDGLVEVTADHAHAWRGADDLLYPSEQAMRDARQEPHPDAGPDGKVQILIAETVGRPWQVLGGESDRKDPVGCSTGWAASTGA